MNQNTLVKIHVSEDCLIFHTYSRHGGSSPRFFISRKKLTRLSDSGSIYARDQNNLAEIYLICRPDGKMYVHMEFYWLSIFGDETISGRRETIHVPLDIICPLLSAPDKTVYRVLSKEYTRRPPVIFQSRKNLHAVVSNRRLRKKLSRCLMSHFHSGSGTIQKVVLYDDCEPGSFYFQEYVNDKLRLSGVLLLSGAQNPKTASYSMHT